MSFSKILEPAPKIRILILLPNSPQAGSEMLNNMVASFTASNQIGEEMKKARMKKQDKK